MKTILSSNGLRHLVYFIVAALLAFQASLTGQTRQEAVASPASTAGKAADNHIYAQKVVNEIMADNPDVLALALHSIPPGVDAKPGMPGQVCIASSLDTIGSKDSANDLAVAEKDQLNMGLAPLGKITRLKVATSFRDGAGNILGYCMISFPTKVDKLTAHARTLAILNTLAKKFPNQGSLYEAIP